MKHYTIISFVAGNCYSYFVADSGEALLIDPHITLVDKYAGSLKRKGLSLMGVVDTHTHADHISSAAMLKDKYGVPLYMSEHAASSIATDRLKDGDVIKVGTTQVRAIYSPGHTDDSVSLLTSQGDLFTGDVLLINSVGRTDFQNGSPEDMFDSLATMAALPDDTVVRPAHDYKGNRTSTIAEQNSNNPFMLEKDKVNFCDNARSKVLPKPFNMDTIIVANQKGTARKYSRVSPKEALGKLAEKETILLDVRTDQELAEISVDMDNVMHVPLQSLAAQIASLPVNASYYTLCKSGARATMAAMVLLQNGLTDVAVIEGGVTAWEKVKLPVKKMSTGIPVERQVRIVAGSLVLAGALLSLVNVWFIAVCLFVGAGLVFAGISDTCLMGSMLMKLPYNKKAIIGDGGTCSLDGGGCSM